MQTVIYGCDFDANPSLLPPPNRNPYYIFTPPYTRLSAGIKALHVLCHSLNVSGRSAFVVVHPEAVSSNVLPELVTPRLDQEVVDYHFQHSLTPIVVYPEIVSGNPLSAPFVARYYLNFPGLLGGDKDYSQDEYRFGYSKVLADAVAAPDDVLFAPVVDTRVFYPQPHGERKGTCFYARKHKMLGGAVFGLPEDCVEIRGSGARDTQSPAEIADLFRRSELFYCFENSALALEAAMCGCPTVLMFSNLFEVPIALHETGWDGFARGDVPAEIQHAKETVKNVYPSYANLIRTFWRQLDRFNAVTQSKAQAVEYKQSVKFVAADRNFHVTVAMSRFHIRADLRLRIRSRPNDASTKLFR